MLLSPLGFFRMNLQTASNLILAILNWGIFCHIVLPFSSLRSSDTYVRHISAMCCCQWKSNQIRRLKRLISWKGCILIRNSDRKFLKLTMPLREWRSLILLICLHIQMTKNGNIIWQMALLGMQGQGSHFKEWHWCQPNNYGWQKWPLTSDAGQCHLPYLFVSLNGRDTCA